jgi:hypothetical protein
MLHPFPFTLHDQCRRARLIALVIGAAAGCSSDGTGPQEVVATVVITAVPTGPILVGQTVQLAATAVNATGGTITGASFTWRTSDPTVASVSRGGLITALGAGSVTVTATAGGRDGTATLDVRAGGSVGNAGGVLTLLNGAFTLNIPPGALPQTVNFLVRPASDSTQNPRLVPATIFEVAPTGVAFFAPASLSLRYDVAKLPTGVVEAALQLYTLSAGAWVLVQGSTVNVAQRTITGSVYRTGTYAVAGTAVDHIALGGAAVDGALYAGQTGQLTATLFDAANNSLTGRNVTWSSSAPTRATVAGGLVTAVSQGSVTISAESEGKTAATTISIITRPTADWSQATIEWTTFQGNPSHTGFVPATVDPVIFSERWVRTVAGGAALNPVTAGPGEIFVSTQTYFGTQRAAAFDLATGSEKWTKDFGAIHGVHPPAYGGGTVYLTTSGHSDSFLWAFDAVTGTQRFKSPYENQWSLFYAPVVVGQRVFMAGGYYGGMYAFDATDGTQVWFAWTNQYDEWTPAVRDGIVYAYTGENVPGVIAADAATGATVLEIPDPDFSWNGWSMNTAPVLGASADLLAVQAGRLVSFDLGTHAIRWKTAGQFTGAVTIAADTLYVINAGTLEARRESDGGLLWSWSPPAGRLEGTTVATRNILFAATSTATYAVDLGARRATWSYPAGGHLAVSSQGVLLIARTDGRLSAISIR